ncbi:hypothetical protein ACFE04_022792 [Oxalis oulophora]
MDLEEWEFLPDHHHQGFMDYKEVVDVPKRRIFSTKRSSNYNMDYFKCPSSPTSRVITLPFHLEHELVVENQDITKLPLEPVNIKDGIIKVEPLLSLPDSASAAVDQDTVSQVFFKKNEFVDMKLEDSPKSPSNTNTNNNNNTRIVPQIDAAAVNFNFDDDNIKVEVSTKKKSTEFDDDDDDHKSVLQEVVVEDNDGHNNRLDLWKMSLTGIGAICSFGVAAATICIILFGTHHRIKHNYNNNQKKLHFQIYTDDKQRIKQVVHHATKLNEAISSVRGVPVTRAHISFGGYYDAL